MKYKENPIRKRVRDSLAKRTSQEIASMRTTIVKPEFLDTFRKKLRKHSTISIEHRDGWYYGIYYGEEELFELLRQLM